MQYDVIIIGGSFAGLSAAMQLVRARRKVLLVDSGKPRNRFAAASHGFLGQDGRKPSDILADAVSQLRRYPTLTYLRDEVVSGEQDGGRFRVTLASGLSLSCLRLILALGVKDQLPSVAGLQERWGVSVLHCPYCHGYEINGGPIGLLASSSIAVHQGLLLPDWGPTKIFLEPGVVFSDDDRAMLLSRGASFETEQVVELLGSGQILEALRLADGRVVELAALFVQSKVQPSSALAEQLGVAMEQGPQGPHIRTEATATSIPGLFAAGDAASPWHNATMASAAGVSAGVAAHRSLVELSLWA
jgi:thioredoxin reductase